MNYYNLNLLFLEKNGIWLYFSKRSSRVHLLHDLGFFPSPPQVIIFRLMAILSRKISKHATVFNPLKSSGIYPPGRLYHCEPLSCAKLRRW